MLEIVKNFTEYDRFVSNHPYGNVMQLSSWGKLKDDTWEPICVVMREEEKIVASALLLIRQFKLGPINVFKMMYSPRGYVIDWQNQQLVEKFHALIVKFAKEQKVNKLTIDPSVYTILSEKNQTSLTTNKAIINTLEKLKFTKVANEDAIQLKHQMYIDLNCKPEQIKNNFSKNIKRYLNKYQKDNIFTIESDTTLQFVKEYAKLSKMTEEKHNIYLRNEQYFAKVIKVFGEENTTIHLSKINQEQLIKNNKLIDQKHLNEKYSNGIFVVYGCNIAEMYYGASNPAFSHYRPTYYTHYWGMLEAQKRSCRYFNLGGVKSLSDEDGLYQFKRKLGAIPFEFIGEYELKINHKFKISMFKIAQKIVKKVR